jgi:hypothetical protein
MTVLYKQQFEKLRTTFYENYNDIVPTLYGRPADNHELQFHGSTKNNKLYKLKSESSTKSDFLENYANLLANIEIIRSTLVVECDENKISLKYYYFRKYRKQGEVFFRKDTNQKFVTYCFKTNDIYSGQIINRGNKKKRRTSLKRNYFGDSPINTLLTTFTQDINSFFGIISSVDKYIYTSNALFEFTKYIPNLKYSVDYPIDVLMYKQYLDIRNIKAPNNYSVFINKVPKPKKRILRKYYNKLIESYMHFNKFKGDKLKKIFHNVKFINESFYFTIQEMFGEEFIRHQSYDDLKTIIEYPNGYNLRGEVINDLSKSEKKNAFKILVDVINNDSSMNTYIDHMSLYNNLKKFEKVKWESTDLISFHEEHMLWAERWSYYTKGIYTRLYNEYFVKSIEETINNQYYPIVLTKSKEYINESSLQNNCVKTYIDRPGSLIVSVREGDPESTERATIEYSITQINNKIKLSRVQSLGKYNNSLSEKWTPILIELDSRINKMVNENQFDLPKVKVSIGGRIIESESNFDSFSTTWLTWTSKDIHRLNNNIFELYTETLF